MAPFFDRSWRIALEPAAGGLYAASSTVSPSETPLRIRFMVEMTLTLAYWQATVDIYNLSASTANQMANGAANVWKFRQPVITGDWVTLSAGYKPSATGSFNADSNVIYTGQILQPIWTRENVVDYVLRLRCITSLADSALNQVAFSVEKGKTDLDATNLICARCGIDADIDASSQVVLGESKYSRGQVIQGRPAEAMRQITRNNNLFSWINQDGLHVRSFDQKSMATVVAKFAYGTSQSDTSNVSASTPIKRTLIGTPQQTQEGIVFQVLMDPSVKIGDVVQLASGVLFAPFQFQYGKDYNVPASQDGKYVVAGIRHIGDSRGTGSDWLTEITGLTLNFFPDFLKTREVISSGK